MGRYALFYLWFICNVSCMYLYRYMQIHTDTQIHTNNACIVCICMYRLAYLVHIVCICMYFLQHKLLVVRYRQIHTNTCRYIQKYMQNTCKYMPNTCTTFKGTLHAYLHVLVCICMYHACILGGVHIVCTSMYLCVSVCIVHMEPCTFQVHICMYHCIC